MNQRNTKPMKRHKLIKLKKKQKKKETELLQEGVIKTNYYIKFSMDIIKAITFYLNANRFNINLNQNRKPFCSKIRKIDNFLQFIYKYSLTLNGMQIRC